MFSNDPKTRSKFPTRYACYKPKFLFKSPNSYCVRNGLAEAQKSGRHTDVVFTFCESEEKISAHKLVLAASSSVFETMFYGNAWATDEVEIADVCPPVFEIFIEFLYTNTLPKHVPIPSAIQILYVARKYCVEDLELAMKEYLNDSITLETVFPILKTSVVFDYLDLETKCWNCIEMDTDRLILTKEFQSLDLGTVQKIIERDCLTTTEGKLYKALLRWAEAECKRQGIESNTSNTKSVLGETLRKIRFPVMDATEFADGPAASGLLSQEEISSTLLTKFSRVIKPPQLFSPTKRVPKPCLSSLNCKCRALKINCVFCRDRCGRDVDSDGQAYPLVPTPTSYCSCRTRDYCPNRKIV